MSGLLCIASSCLCLVQDIYGTCKETKSAGYMHKAYMLLQALKLTWGWQHGQLQLPMLFANSVHVASGVKGRQQQQQLKGLSGTAWQCHKCKQGKHF